MKKIFLSFIFGASLCFGYGDSNNDGFNLSYGNVYPEMSLAPMENPSVLCLGKSDRLSALAPLPFLVDTQTNKVNKTKTDWNNNPAIFSFTTSPKPFGVGLLATSAVESELYASIASGTNLVQLGYTYHTSPKSQSATNNFSLRLGAANEHAITLQWGDEKKSIGVGFVFGWFVFDLDVTTNTVLEGAPTYFATLGLQNEIFGVNFGYEATALKDLRDKKDNKHFGIYLQSFKHLNINLYYQRFLAQITAGLTVLI